MMRRCGNLHRIWGHIRTRFAETVSVLFQIPSNLLFTPLDNVVLTNGHDRPILTNRISSSTSGVRIIHVCWRSNAELIRMMFCGVHRVWEMSGGKRWVIRSVGSEFLDSSEYPTKLDSSHAIETKHNHSDYSYFLLSLSREDCQRSRHLECAEADDPIDHHVLSDLMRLLSNWSFGFSYDIETKMYY